MHLRSREVGGWGGTALRIHLGHKWEANPIEARTGQLAGTTHTHTQLVTGPCLGVRLSPRWPADQWRCRRPIHWLHRKEEGGRVEGSEAREERWIGLPSLKLWPVTDGKQSVSESLLIRLQRQEGNKRVCVCVWQGKRREMSAQQNGRIDDSKKKKETPEVYLDRRDLTDVCEI